MTFIQFTVFLLGVCAGYAIGFSFHLPLWGSALMALFTGIFAVVTFIAIRLLMRRR
jgi:hypothetical protein